MTKPPIIAAVIQAAPVVFNINKTLDKIDDLAADAAKHSAQIAVFPEAFVSAYPKGLDFGARVGSRSSGGRIDFQRYFDSSIDVPGSATERIGKALTETVVYTIIGHVGASASVISISML